MNPPRRRLIVNADDFGRTASINAAVVRGHREGILTSASLMVNESAAAEAVALARENPGLGVGLHLTLAGGRSALPCERIPGLADVRGAFRSSPFAAGWRYFFERSLRSQLRDELGAQFERFHTTGLRLDHVNAHLHFHLHPVVCDVLMENASKWGVTRMRLTRDPLGLNARLASGRWIYRATHAVVFRWLSRRAAPAFARANVRHTKAVFGLLQDGRVEEQFLLRLLPALPEGDSELYSHPCADQFPAELEALISPRVRELVQRLGLQLIRHQDL